MRFLNTKPEFNSGTEYEVKITLAKTKERIDRIKEDSLDPELVLNSELEHGNSIIINPLSVGKDGYGIGVDFKNEKYDDYHYYVVFFNHDLIDVDIRNHSFKFKNSDGDVISLTKAKKTKFQYAF
jgi:hypothetical protein